MTRKEVTELFSVMLLAWPNAEMFKGDAQKMEQTIKLWAKCLPDVDFWTAQQAVIKLCRECKFPPSIAEFKERADRVAKEVEEQMLFSWEQIKQGIQLGQTPQEVFDELLADNPAKLAIAAMGGPSMLMVTRTEEYSDGPGKSFETFNFEGFSEAYIQAIHAGRTLGGRKTQGLSSGTRMKQIGG